MKSLRAWFLRLGGLFGRERREKDLAAELESHLQLHTEDNLRAGMGVAEARRQALIKLGGVEQTKEMVRERRGLPMIEVFLQDLRFGVRMLGKNTGFMLIAVLTLALGIGVNVSVFSLMDFVLLRPLAVPNPERMTVLTRGASSMFSYPDYADLRDRNGSFREPRRGGGDDFGKLCAGFGNPRLPRAMDFRRERAFRRHRLRHMATGVLARS